MTRFRTDRLLVVDLELTCWSGEPPVGMSPEIIEIGIVEIDTAALEIARSARYLVRPYRSEVSDFCADFTGLTAVELRSARPFKEVSNTIRKAFGTQSKTWFGWGADNEAVARECEANGAQNPFSSSYVNFGHLWSLMTGVDHRIALEDAMKMVGSDPVGRLHSALADATNTARLWIELSRSVRPLIEPAPLTIAP